MTGINIFSYAIMTAANEQAYFASDRIYVAHRYLFVCPYSAFDLLEVEIRKSWKL